jgi:hypothetical protein
LSGAPFRISQTSAMPSPSQSGWQLSGKPLPSQSLPGQLAAVGEAVVVAVGLRLAAVGTPSGVHVVGP